MANLFAKLKTWLPKKAKQFGGVSVTYSRAGATVPLTAIQGRTVFSSQLDDGVRIEFGDRDYLIEASELTFGEPQIGDRITETLAGVVEVYEVLTPGTGERAWRWSDPAHTTYRVHTKQVQ